MTNQQPMDNRRSKEDRRVTYLARARGISTEAARQQLRLQHRSSDLKDAVRALLGDRLGLIRFDDEGYIRFTIVDMTPADVEAIDRIARETGVAEWVRTERADPVDLQAWEEVRHELLRISETRPDVLMGQPSPAPGYRRPPFHIGLAAYATDVAAELHRRFGAFVALQVGAMQYPLTPGQHRSRKEKAQPTINPAEIQVELDGPLERQQRTHGHAWVERRQ